MILHKARISKGSFCYGIDVISKGRSVLLFSKGFKMSRFSIFSISTSYFLSNLSYYFDSYIQYSVMSRATRVFPLKRFYQVARLKLHYSSIREHKHATFLSHGRQPEMSYFPIK